MTILFITGTDTGAGKTVLATLLTQWLRASGVRVAALKPLCSGRRADAAALRAAAGQVLPLDTVNPWHFRAPLAPVLAARRERQQVRLAEVVEHIRRVSRGFEVVVVEGAGGLLSPLGEDFASRELIRALKATPIVVAPNRLGAVNAIRLTLAALPPRCAARTQVVFFDPPRPDSATRTNAGLLGEFIAPAQIHRFPWLRGGRLPVRAPRRGRLHAALQTLVQSLGLAWAPAAPLQRNNREVR